MHARKREQDIEEGLVKRDLKRQKVTESHNTPAVVARMNALHDTTLARRGKDLERAQRDIEVAAGLAAHGNLLGPQIGLEAGVIAVLAGHDSAARKSWNSVVAAAPDSEEARQAKDYLAQLGPETPGAPLDRPAPPPTSQSSHQR